MYKNHRILFSRLNGWSWLRDHRTTFISNSRIKKWLHSEFLQTHFRSVCRHGRVRRARRLNVNTWTAASTIICAFNLNPLTISRTADPESWETQELCGLSIPEKQELAGGFSQAGTLSKAEEACQIYKVIRGWSKIAAHKSESEHANHIQRECKYKQGTWLATGFL